MIKFEMKRQEDVFWYKRLNLKRLKKVNKIQVIQQQYLSEKERRYPDEARIKKNK